MFQLNNLHKNQLLYKLTVTDFLLFIDQLFDQLRFTHATTTKHSKFCHRPFT
jgi:hypothetical protein